MTTPEQLQAWREQFEAKHKPHKLTRYSGGAYQLDYMEDMWAGYLRAKQENEQVMKLAKFGAMVAASHMSGDLLDGDDFTDGMLAVELLLDVDGSTKFVDGIESTIMEVLK